MKRYLVKYQDNWADEMNVYGLKVLSETEYEEFQKALDERESLCFYVGSNQDIEYRSNREIKGAVTIKEISETEYSILRKFGLTSMGQAANFIECIMEDDDC